MGLGGVLEGGRNGDGVGGREGVQENTNKRRQTERQLVSKGNWVRE